MSEIKGYKVFNSDWTCREFQYEVGKTFEYEGNIELCGKGFHFCQVATDCFNYYSFNPNNKVAEVLATGLCETEGNKTVTDKMTVVREITWQEMLTIVNTGKGCTGLKNTGDKNTGNKNTGDCNTGDCNTGDWNTGDKNTGDKNTGNWNTGNKNMGNKNTGNWNTGDKNTGDWNTGDCNTGDWNTGDKNTGDKNTGNWNTGNKNTGDWNTGDKNTGDCNTGDCNTGNWNTGDWNTGDCNTGFFSTINPKITLFEKESNLTIQQARDILGIKIINWNYENNFWIYEKNMTEEEKQNNPTYKTTGGYLKSIPFKDACSIMWGNLTDEEKQDVKEIPNFDARIFKEITGIDV